MIPKIEEITKIAYSFKETVYSTYSLATELLQNKVKGDFVECGVAAGAQIMAMQRAILDGRKFIFNQSPLSPEIWAFDSFEGIPLAGINDENQPGIGEITHDVLAPQEERLVSSGITAHPLENVKKNFENFGYSTENVHFVKGWFQHTIPEYYQKISDIALLRLDGDLYESTLVCMQYLYEKVVTNGIVIIDDYKLPGCKKAIVDYFSSICELLPHMLLVEGGDGVVFFYKK